jgi:hypothetical protein
MAHFAKLTIGNIVEKIEVVSNDIATTEQAGIDFLNNLYKTNDVWKQTSYNTHAGTHILGGTPFRKNYAGIGFHYDDQKDAFIGIKPYNSWVFDEDTCRWNPAVELPNDSVANGGSVYYEWEESNKNWKAVI